MNRDREAKLQSAKEKLKQFQKRRLKEGGPGDESSSEPRMSPVVSKTPDIPVFRMFGDEGGSLFSSEIPTTASATERKDFQDSRHHPASFFAPTPSHMDTFSNTVNNVNFLPEQNPHRPLEPVIFPGGHHFANDDNFFINPMTPGNGELAASASQSLYSNDFEANLPKTSTNFAIHQDATSEPHDGHENENSMSSFTKSSSLSIHSEGGMSNCSGETSQDVHANDITQVDFAGAETRDPKNLLQATQESSTLPNYMAENYASAMSNSSEIKALQAEMEVLKRSKEEVEKELLLKATSVKQYDLYCQSLASELTTTQATLEKERREARSHLENETGSLRSQLQSHAESIKIIVAEKAEYEATVKKMAAELSQKSVELAKYQESGGNQVQAKKQEEEIMMRLNAEMEEKSQAAKRELELSKRSIEDLNQEVSELRSKIAARELTNEKLSAELKVASSKLEMVELNLSQLRSASDIDDVRREEAARLAEKEEEILKVTAENAEHVQRVAELTAYIQQASIDREQIIHQYTSYSQQLTNQIEILTKQLNDKAKEAHLLATREKDLVDHVEQLETQLQKLIQSESTTSKSKIDHAELLSLKERLKKMENKAQDLTMERDLLQDAVQKQKEEIVRLTETLNESSTDFQTELEMLRSQKSSDVSQLDLVAACQSDKVAASRAMMQNKQLKQQLEELQEAIIQVNNSKADMVSELDMMRSFSSRAEKEERTLKMEISGLQTALNDRDRTIEHLREQTKYYIAFAENSINGNLESGPRDPSGSKDQIKRLLGDLQTSKDEIATLTSQNADFQTQLAGLQNQAENTSAFVKSVLPVEPEHSYPSPPLSESSISSELGSPRPNSTLPEGNGFSNEVSHEDSNHQVVHLNEKPKEAPENLNKDQHLRSGLNLVPILTNDVALLKLEQKFNQAMSRIAELSSEKEHLEHLVIQLQEETETVGEYITIYQYQRQQQRKRLDENERQLQVVSKDREDLKRKLFQLQNLVTSFVQDGKPNPVDALSNGETLQIDLGVDVAASLSSNPSPVPAAEAPAVKKRVAKVDFTEPTAPVVIQNESTNVTPTHKPPSPSKADKILALISEIGANQILNNMEDFQPWFWEPSPGKLINI